MLINGFKNRTNLRKDFLLLTTDAKKLFNLINKIIYHNKRKDANLNKNKKEKVYKIIKVLAQTSKIIAKNINQDKLKTLKTQHRLIKVKIF